MDLSNLITGLGIVAVILLACGVLVVAVVLNAWGTIKREVLGTREQRDVHVHPNPLTVREHTEFATRAEMAEVKADLDDMRGQLTRDKDEILKAGSLRGRAIYDHIDDVRRELAARVDDMPSKIIADLANFKNFGGAK